MNRHLSIAWLSLGCLIAAACGGDDPAPTPTPDAGDEDTDDVQTDGSATPDTDTGTDAEAPDATADAETPDTADAGEPDVEEDVPLPECDEDERLVGRRCYGPFDRICLEDSQCRETETCEFVDADEFGTCIYTIPDTAVCPGGPDCAPDTEAVLQAGFARRVITPQGWELARPAFMRNPDAYGSPRDFSGDVRIASHFCDCGRDLICPPEAVESGCLSLGEWTAPDADGTEGDRYMSGAWIAGFGNNRNAALCPEALLSPECEGFDCCDNQFAHDDMLASGTVLDFGNTRVAIVVVDTVGYFYSEVQRIQEQLDPAWGIDHLIVSATHTHEAPDTMGRWGPGVSGGGLPGDTGIIPPWMAEIRQAVLDVVEESVNELQPVDVYFAQGNHGGDGFAARDSRVPFIYNDLVSVMQFVPAGADPRGPGNTVGTLFNYHNHPEALGDANPYISSDFPHYVREYMENGFPEETTDEERGVTYGAYPALGGVTVYISGTVGGLLTQLGATVRSREGENYLEDGYGKAHAQGQRLADFAHAMLANPCSEGETKGCAFQMDAPDLAFAAQEFMLEIENIQFQAAAISLGLFDREVYNWRSDLQTISGPFPKVITRVSQVRLGNVTFQTAPGELFPETLVGYRREQVVDGVIFGDYGDSLNRTPDINCTEDGLTRLPAESPDTRYGCLIELNQSNPPDMDAAPSTPDEYLRGFIPGDYLLVIGLGNDELGYLVPSYDFKWGSTGGLVEAEGDHYEETVSPGDVMPEILDAMRTITDALNDAE
jgi:hypothetical protein